MGASVGSREAQHGIVYGWPGSRYFPILKCNSNAHNVPVIIRTILMGDAPPLVPSLSGRSSMHWTRIIGWGIRFKLQMPCPQEDE